MARLPTFTNDRIADYLETGYFGDGGPRKFNMLSSGTGANNGQLYYNVENLTADGETLADEALAIYEEVLGIEFIKTNSRDGHVDIFFEDDGTHNGQAAAFANSTKT